MNQTKEYLKTEEFTGQIEIDFKDSMVNCRRKVVAKTEGKVNTL